MNLKGNWNYPTAIRFGAGRIAELPQACRDAGIARPLLVTDPGLARLAMVQDALKSCATAGLGVALFSDVKANPVEKNVADGLAVFRAGKHDGVIAFGGGSALDAAKVIAFMAGQTRPMWDFEDVGDWWTRADPKGIAPSVAVPTTSGTGSEVGRAGVIIDEATHTKKIIFHPKMMPSIVIADPALTVGLPPHITAATGMDALAHCLEAYCAPFYHPYAEGVALEGMRLVRENLPRAVKDGKDIAARAHMMAAAGMGATAFQKGTRRNPFALAPGRRGARHAPRPHQCCGDALCAGVQPPGDRGQDRARVAVCRPCRRELRGLHGLGADAAQGDRHPAHAQGPRHAGEPGRAVLRDGGRRPDRRRQPGQGRRARDEAHVRGEPGWGIVGGLRSRGPMRMA
jgi:alcohol dehydrogenase class IV